MRVDGASRVSHHHVAKCLTETGLDALAVGTDIVSLQHGTGPMSGPFGPVPALVHGVMTAGAAFIRVDGVPDNQKSLWTNRIGTEFLETAGYAISYAGHPGVGYSLVAVGALANIMGGALMDDRD